MVHLIEPVGPTGTGHQLTLSPRSAGTLWQPIEKETSPSAQRNRAVKVA